MTNIELKIDTSAVRSELSRLSGLADKAIVQAMNDSAFDLRKNWLGDIDRDVDRPKPFTRRVFVNRAGDIGGEAVTFMPPIQAGYLEKIVGGGVRSGGDVGTLRGKVLVPAGVRLDRHGNFVGGAKRWTAQLETKHPTAFLTKGKKGTNIFERKKSGLKLLAMMKDQTKYRKTLDLDRSALKSLGTFDEFVSKNVSRLLRSK